MGFYFGEIEAFPVSKTILVKMSPYETSGPSYETELIRDERVLASLFRRLHIATTAPDVPCTEFKNYARLVLKRHVGSFYCSEDNIQRLLAKFSIDLTPESRFPGGDSGARPEAGTIPRSFDTSVDPGLDFKEDTVKVVEDYNMVFSETHELIKALVLNNKVIPEGSEVTFHHFGTIKE